MSYADTVKFLVAMIIMMNPLGSLSIFFELTPKTSLARQRKIAVQCGFAIAVLMIVSLWLGSELLELLGITIASFRVTGGLILIFVGFSMLQSQQSAVTYTKADDAAAEERNSIAIVPLALPIIIGPGTISTLVIASTDYPNIFLKMWLSFWCLFLAVGMAGILYFGSTIRRLVGESVIKVITRIMGMIIMAIAVGMLADGLVGLIPALR